MDTSSFPPAYDPASNAEDYDKAGDYCKQQKLRMPNLLATGNNTPWTFIFPSGTRSPPPRPSALLYVNRAMALEQLGQYAAAEHDCQHWPWN
jgi:hypothetical protein